MTNKYKQTLEALAQTLVTPERFGKVALAEVVELHPQAEVFELPQVESD